MGIRCQGRKSSMDGAECCRNVSSASNGESAIRFACENESLQFECARVLDVCAIMFVLVYPNRL